MLVCPDCGSCHVDVQVFQEETQSDTKTWERTKYRERGHGCLWWLLIGWWWWIIELFLWIFFFIPMALLRIGRKRKYEGRTYGKSRTNNMIEYRRVFLCKDCGCMWED